MERGDDSSILLKGKCDYNDNVIADARERTDSKILEKCAFTSTDTEVKLSWLELSMVDSHLLKIGFTSTCFSCSTCSTRQALPEDTSNRRECVVHGFVLNRPKGIKLRLGPKILSIF